MKNENARPSKTEVQFYLNEKKKNAVHSPDISKMQIVEIDGKTTIYIAAGASSDDARNRYAEYLRNRK